MGRVYSNGLRYQRCGSHGAATALVGVRVNGECGCHGDSDVTLYRFRYTDNASTAVAQRDFTNGLYEWGMVVAAYVCSDGRWTVAGRLFLQMVPSVVAIGVVNAANYAGGAVSPGEIVTVFGELMGEPLLTTLELNAAGSLARELFNTRLLFDGIAAPLIYASSRQISAI